MHYEGKTLAEMGWGTHETWMPKKMRRHKDPNAYATYMEQSGFRTLVRSWVPLGGEIQGFALQHRETVSIPDYFTVLFWASALMPLGITLIALQGIRQKG